MLSAHRVMTDALEDVDAINAGGEIIALDVMGVMDAKIAMIALTAQTVRIAIIARINSSKIIGQWPTKKARTLGPGFFLVAYSNRHGGKSQPNKRIVKNILTEL
jgi:hypothetical protein